MAIYFVQCTATQLIKIGYSSNPAKRFISLQTGSSAPLRVLHTVDGDKSKEAELHKRFRHLWARGEWYFPSDEIHAFIGGRKKFLIDLWSAVPGAYPFQMTSLASNGTKLAVPASSQLITAYDVGHGILTLSVDPYACISSDQDYMRFAAQGGILPVTAKVLDEIAQKSGFVKRMFPDSVIDGTGLLAGRAGASLLEWRSIRGHLPHSIKEAIAAMYKALQDSISA